MWQTLIERMIPTDSTVLSRGSPLAPSRIESTAAKTNLPSAPYLAVHRVVFRLVGLLVAAGEKHRYAPPTEKRAASM